MSGNTPTSRGPSDPESSKPLTWSLTAVCPAQIGQWGPDANVPQAPWSLEGDSDSEMEAELHTTPRARLPPPPMKVQTASCTLTNPLDCNLASTPTPAPISRTASRIGKKSRPSHPYSTTVSAAAAIAALHSLLPPPVPHRSSIFLSSPEYAARHQSLSGQPNHIIPECWAHVINQSVDDPESGEDLIAGTTTRDPTNRDIMTAILAAIHSLQTQIIALAEKQASTTSTVSFLADECNRIRVGVTKLQQEAGHQ